MLGKESQLFFFKNKMVLSTKDYVIICCLAVIALIAVATTIYMKPLEFFHVISKEQFKDIIQEVPQEMFSKNLDAPSFQKNFQQQLYVIQHVIELWRAAGWNGVWAFVCLFPQIILGCLIAFFPFIFFLRAILKRELKRVLQQLEKSLGWQATNDSTECEREKK
ncbi:hypothetical protein NPX99_05480 [Bartonella sp. 220]|uniref:hypothetical protein n=1 Tax=Bartonella sp. 220B TaxID=2967260 RepID=UPI0022A91088|nr:hypothetical protein [Bartonella sp. 220B]MCZ2158724.1 hypothetical protein [Bartonella sp. 220B]